MQFFDVVVIACVLFVSDKDCICMLAHPVLSVNYRINKEIPPWVMINN